MYILYDSGIAGHGFNCLTDMRWFKFTWSQWDMKHDYMITLCIELRAARSSPGF